MKQPLSSHFRKLTLTQQVLSLILLSAAFLILFFIFFLSGNITRTVDTQIYQTMAARQRPVVQALNKGKTAASDEELFNYLGSDPYLTTWIVTPEQAQMISVSGAQNHSMLELSSRLIQEARAMLVTGSGAVEQGQLDWEGRQMYFRMDEASTPQRHAVVVSFMDDAYSKELRTALMDSTIYVTTLAFFLVLVIFLFWVFSIIHPLNQIKAYISQIKEGKDVDLYINRDDEIGDVAKELRKMTQELKKQEKSKEEMIHNISHDLKTPIATIKSYSESIKDGIFPYGDLESSVDVILDNAKRLEDKVHSLLYMNRVEYLITSDAEGVTTNMKDVVEQVVLNAAVIRPEIEIITDAEEVYFDGLLESWRVCVENIMENAFRYAKSYIKIVVRENELIISNDGQKMPEDRIASLFKPYIKGEGGRFGLGLSIVSKVVAANKYKVKGLNTEDGVAFRIYRNAAPKPPRGNHFWDNQRKNEFARKNSEHSRNKKAPDSGRKGNPNETGNNRQRQDR